MTFTDTLAGSTPVRAITRSYWAIFGAIILVAGIARYWTIAHNPGYELDEAVYTSIGRNVANGNGIHAGFDGPESQTYLSHPPFHFLILGAWMKLTGAEGVTSARVFSATCSLIVIAGAALVMRRYFGDLASLLAMGGLATSSWLIFENRIAWLENPQMILFVALLAVYWRAERSPSLPAWALVGGLLGAVVIYKHVGAAFALGIGLAMLLRWRQIPNTVRAILAAGLTCLLVVVAYVLVMWAVFGDAFMGQSLNQFRRSTGEESSPGVLKLTPTMVLTALQTPYWVFVGTGIITVAAFAFAAWRLYAVVRWNRGWQNTELTWALSVATMAALTLLQLRFPHYFIMVFIPTTLYLAQELALLDLSRVWRKVLAGSLVVLTVANLVGTTIRMAWAPDNAVQYTAQWVQDNARPGDVFIGEESIGNLINMDWCKSITAECAQRGTLVETYKSYTQNLPENPRFAALVDEATPCVSFKGFRETITVYAVPPRTC